MADTYKEEYDAALARLQQAQRALYVVEEELYHALDVVQKLVMRAAENERIKGFTRE